MLQLRSKLLFLALGCAITCMFGVQALAVEDANCARCKKRPRPAAKEQAVYKEMARVATNTAKLLGAKSEIREDIVKTLSSRALCSSKQVTKFATTTHYIRELAPNGDLVTIQDGSVWSVRERDQLSVKAWHPHSEIVITPNSLNLWGKITRKALAYKYRISNFAANSTVEANLSLGPFKNDPNTLRIRRIDRTHGVVYFTDGSRWQADRSNVSKAVFSDWKVGHFVIPGTNNTWFGLHHSDIIINVSTDNWVPATHLN